jgi:hypothetical protein
MRKLLFDFGSFKLKFYSLQQTNIIVSLQQNIKIFYLKSQKGNSTLIAFLLSKIGIPIHHLKNTLQFISV